MKKIILIILIIACTACSSKRVPPNACHMKQKEKISILDRELKFKGNVVRYEGDMSSCLFLVFGCRYIETKIDKKNNIILKTGRIFSSERKVAKLEKDRIKYEKTIFSNIADISNMQISIEDKKVYWKSESKALQKFSLNKRSKGSGSIDINSSCNYREAAIGSVTLLSARNLGI
ncbi:hypothetical protein N9N67_07855 [Bacteriovoracaceae bacterium]|nr:hypothetical protein [Bacteriovoracaceae bacterium]